jgi:hypothetical protein
MRFLIATIMVAALASSAMAQRTVRGYVKKNGAYVQQHHRTSPDHTQRNNYSAKGNVNPYTGKPGTKKVAH